MAAEAALPPPAALLEFLGEAPSEAALKRPTSSRGAPEVQAPPASARAAPSPAAARNSASRGRGEDSSPETPGLPSNDGGFDDWVDDRKAPNPEAEPLPAKASKARGPTSPHRRQANGQQVQAGTAAVALPPRAPQAGAYPEAAVRSPAGSTAESFGKRGNVPHGSVPRGRGTEPSFSKTMSPAPAGLAAMLGEASTDAALRHSSSGTPKSGASSRPRSGSRRARERSSTPNNKVDSVTACALDLDPLGSSGRRRFGGRG
mmetsp:Transcript_147228/g.256960  ORF Transcript_147228/g.256960 Transcript_147228/m.256960 type:complete len:260 (-) Transcript_147228:97-876(-)